MLVLFGALLPLAHTLVVPARRQKPWRGLGCRWASAGTPGEEKTLNLAVSKPMGLVFEENDAPYRGLRVVEVAAGSAGEVAGVAVNDQLVSVEGNDATGMEFDQAMDLLAAAPQAGVSLGIYRGAVEDIPATPSVPEIASEGVEISVQQEDGSVTRISGENNGVLRNTLLENKVDLYTFAGKLTNCNGGGQCGTCVVEVLSGEDRLTIRTDAEERKLSKKPSNFRLACQVLTLGGEVTLKTKP